MHKTVKIYSLVATFYIMTAQAEVILDGTLGSAGTLQGPHFAIEASLGQQVGNNLFHSFAKFNLNSEESATFSGSNQIENVINRVTGGEPSHIDGALHSQIPHADIYFLNPAGVMFGPNARLNVQGSLYISTADYLRLGETGRFNATFPEQSLLTVAPPSAFGFLSESPASISKDHGFLKVPTGKTLSWIGGDLNLQDGRVAIQEDLIINSLMGAPSGQINLISVASTGEVPINPEEISDTAFEQFGTITITDTTTGTDNFDRVLANVDVSGTGGGSVYIQGGRIIFDNGYVYADTLGEENGKNITVKASEELVLANGSLITTGVFENNAFEKTSGDSGNITVTARQISITDGSRISTLSRIPLADAGNIRVSAQTAINISGRYAVPANQTYSSGIFSNTTDTGNGGQITIRTPNLTVANDGDIRTDTQGLGHAGDIDVQVNTLTLTGGGQINLSSGNRKATIGTGRGGHLTLTARKNVLISGHEGETKPSGLLSNVFTAGEGGTIKVLAPLLEIRQQGTIQAGTQGKGNAGQITLEVDNLHIQQNGFITSESKATGNAGTIHITAEDLTLHNGAITTQADKSGGGDIFIRGNNRFDLKNSTISARAQGTQAHHQGGNLSIDNPNFLILEKSQLLANAYAGNGGNIRIIAEQFIRSSDSILDASSQLGIDGNIMIRAPENDIESGLTVLPTPFLKALLKRQCAVRGEEQSSYLVILGRGGIPQSPANLLTHTLLPSTLGN